MNFDADAARAWVVAAAAAVTENADHLTQLDSAIGDADHGVNLKRGFTAVTAALDGFAADGPGAVLVKTGTTLISKVGGASGPLYGSGRAATRSRVRKPTPRRSAPHCATAWLPSGSSAPPPPATRPWSTPSTPRWKRSWRAPPPARGPPTSP
ncbi:hypothetical protein GCM10009558_087190 [Virgisporangium aurantiacum]